MKKKVECVQVRQLIALDGALDHAAKMLGYALARHVPGEQLVPLRPQCDQTDVRRVTLVAGPRVGNIDEPYLHWTISTEVFTTDLSINAGQ